MPATPKNPTEATAKKRKALVCDDDVDFCEQMKEFLTRLDFDVTTCQDGIRAAALVRDSSFDFITIDVRIPSMNGLQVCAIARATNTNRNAKIFVITGDSDPSIITRAESTKVNRLIHKPIDLTEFGKAINAEFAKSGAKISYDVRIINAFLEAASEIYEFYLHQKPKRGKVSIRQQGTPEKGICTGLIALTGDGFAGSLGLSMTAPFIKKLAEALFAGMDIKFDNEFIADVTAEMCNQVLGKVKINFAKLGIGVTIGLPEVVSGKDHIIQHRVENPVISVPMGVDDAIFEMQFVLSKRDVKVGESKPADVPPASVIMFD